MSTELIVVITTAITALIFMLGSPVVLCLGLWVGSTTLLLGDFSLVANIGQSSINGLKSFALLAMPLFILTGDLVLHSGIAKAIVRLSKSLFGWLPGNTAITTLWSSGIFAAISGSNAATTATIGSMMHSELCKQGYDRAFAGATCASGGTVGIIIPPSVLFIVYGVLTSLSIGDLFIAGILPGVLMVFSMAVVASCVAWRRGWDKPVRPSGRGALAGVWQAKHAFIAIVFAIGGIYLGAFSPTEAAGMTVAYLMAATIITGMIRPGRLPAIMLGSAELIGVLGPLIAFSVVLQQLLSFLGVDRTVQEALLSIDSRTALIFAMMGIILVSGMLLESLPNVIIWAPILAPAAVHAGFDPVHFGVVFMVGIAIGFITPPYGLNLFVASGVTGEPFITLARRIVPYVIALSFVWWLVIVLPGLSLWLL